MKVVLAVFPKANGGEYISVKNLTSSLRQISSQKIFIEEISNITPIWSKKKRFQLLHWLGKSIYFYFRISIKYHTKAIGIYYSNDLLFLFLIAIFNIFKDKKIKLIYHFHGRRHDSLKEELKKETNIFKKILYIWPLYGLITIIENYAFRQVTKIIVPHKYSLKDLKYLYGKFNLVKIEVITNAYEKEIFYPLKNNSKRSKVLRLVFAGQIEPRKRIRDVIDAFLIIQKQIRSHLTIIYPQITNEDYKPMLKKAFNHKNIILIKSPERKIIGNIFRTSDLCLMPSKEEHHPLVYLEALASGLPVLTSFLPSINRAQEKISKKLILRVVSPKTIADAVLGYYYLKSSSKADIIKKCLREASNYSWHKSALKLKTIIELA